jgi:hypothetical protein
MWLLFISVFLSVIYFLILFTVNKQVGFVKKSDILLRRCGNVQT